jgi:hypothetical protein
MSNSRNPGTKPSLSENFSNKVKGISPKSGSNNSLGDHQIPFSGSPIKGRAIKAE